MFAAAPLHTPLCARRRAPGVLHAGGRRSMRRFKYVALRTLSWTSHVDATVCSTTVLGLAPSYTQRVGRRHVPATRHSLPLRLPRGRHRSGQRKMDIPVHLACTEPASVAVRVKPNAFLRESSAGRRPSKLRQGLRRCSKRACLRRDRATSEVHGRGVISGADAESGVFLGKVARPSTDRTPRRTACGCSIRASRAC